MIYYIYDNIEVVMKGKFSVGNNDKLQDADFVIIPKKSKRRNFVMFDRDGLLELACNNYSTGELRLVLYLMAHRESKYGTIVPTTGVILSKDLKMTQCSISRVLTSLKKKGILIVDTDCTRDWLPVSGFTRWRINRKIATC